MKKKTKIIITVLVFIIVAIVVVGAAVIFPQVSHEHVAGEITCNEVGHWYKCANGCDKMLNEIGEVIEDPFPHDFSGDIFYVTDNSHAYKCTICGVGGYNGVAFTSQPCHFVWEKEGPNSVEGTHYKMCADCGHIDETTRGNHVIDPSADNHDCSICGLVNILVETGGPEFHYFENGFETTCSAEGCDAVLKAESDFISSTQYFVKLNHIPYMDASGEMKWNSTPIMIIQECTDDVERTLTGKEIAIAPEYDEENHEWIFDLSQYHGHYLIKRIENIAGYSEGIEINDIYKNEE